MTEELFRDDAALLQCRARVLAADAQGVRLDRTVFYPQGGGQAGDAGVLQLDDGRVLKVVDTRKGDAPGEILHLLAEGTDLAGLAPGCELTACIDETRRRAHMRFHTATHLLCALVPHAVNGCSITARYARFHTATHLLCALVPHAVNGCSITARYARLDFHMHEPLDREQLTQGIARLVAEAHPVRHRWIGEEELDANPLDRRGRTRRQPAAGAQHERAAAARPGPHPRAGNRRRGPAALRRHPRGQYRRHRRRRRDEG